MVKVAALIEQFWHRVPGGTGRATAETLQAMIELNEKDLELVGIKAWHPRANKASFSVDIQTERLHLPRPTLYGRWLDGKAPSIDGVGHDVAWASAMVVPTTNTPVVTTVHDLDFLNYPETLSRRGSRFFPRAWQAAKDRSDRIVCPSQYVAGQCLNQGVDSSIIEVVPWGVKPPERTNLVSDEFSQLSVDEGYLLWVGTKEPRKNLKRLVEAFDASMAHTLVLVGPKGWEQDPNLSTVSEGKNLIVLPQVSDELLSELYQNASAFVFPSLAEGFGLPVLEAMIRSTPVITSGVAATAEVAGDAALTVDPLDVGEISQAIDSVLDSASLRSELALAGLQRAEAFSWSSAAKDYLDIFRAVA